MADEQNDIASFAHYARGFRGRSFHRVRLDEASKVVEVLCVLNPSDMTVVIGRRPELNRYCRLCRRAESRS